ncbi:MAG TPA: SCP2 sterol-binding domain-containing protein [Acidimicrobiales bacterium]|nr:SCP2 sterol-binding domain-containing protein [Acidimicrobiales bacterium]
MPRFLSAEWFDAIRVHAGHHQPGDKDPAQPPHSLHGPHPDRLVLEQVVTGSPEGNVRYFVVVENGNARLVEPGFARQVADLTITTDWDTATAMARGELATQAALMQGKLRVRGNLTKLAGRAGELAGLDPIPEAIRKVTTY